MHEIQQIYRKPGHPTRNTLQQAYLPGQESPNVVNWPKQAQMSWKTAPRVV